MKFLGYLLLERNIINTEVVDRYLGGVMGLIHRPDNALNRLGKWVFSNLKNYLLRDYPVTWVPNDLIHRYINADKPWIKKVVTRNDKLYEITIGPGFDNQITHVIDFFIANPDLNISRMSVPEAIRQSIEWNKTIGKQKETEEDPEGAKTIRKYSSDFRWVKITSEQAARREGILMHHSILTSCWPGIKSGQKAAYSLRDKDNIPHCTIELTNNVIRQIKGNSNLEVKEKYRRYVINFLNKPIEGKNYNGVEDLDNVGLIELDGNYLEIDKLTASDKEEFIDKIMEYLGSHPVEKGDHRVLGWANDIIEISNINPLNIRTNDPEEIDRGYKYRIEDLFGKYSEKIFDEIRKGLRKVTLGTILEYYVIAKRDFDY